MGSSTVGVAYILRNRGIEYYVLDFRWDLVLGCWVRLGAGLGRLEASGDIARAGIATLLVTRPNLSEVYLTIESQRDNKMQLDSMYILKSL